MDLTPVTRFRGLNNVSDPLRLGMQWLVRADNVNITDSGSITKREGYQLSRPGVFKSAFSTDDFTRAYFATDTNIQTFEGVVIHPLISQAPMFWTEVNDQVFFNNGIDSGIILGDNSVLPWRWSAPAAPRVSAVTGSLAAGTYQVRCTLTMADGRETGASDALEITLAKGQALQISGLEVGCNVYLAPADSDVFQLVGVARSTAITWSSSPDTLGRDLVNEFLDPLPAGADVIQVWRGRVYAAQYMPSEDQTALWVSEPLGFHLFDLSSGLVMVPGRVVMLAPHDSALIIGTESRVYSYDGQAIKQLAQYGVLPGQHWSSDGDRVLFWSARGLCAALPFTNLTEERVSVAPGVRAGGCVVETGGQKRYLSVIQQGGSPFNAL